MNKILLSLIFPLLIGAVGICQLTDKREGENNLQTKELPRIAIAGIAIESSTFSPAFTHEKQEITKLNINSI